VNVNRGLRNLFAGELDEYELEVTSPGLSEPLKVYQQYEKNVGKKVEVLLKQDRKKISGKLLDVDDRGIKLEEKKRIKTEKNKKKTVREEYSIDFDDIEYTKPVISF
jgi:ribosome maturation factor RimP